MARTKPNSSPNKSRRSTSIQSTLLSQGSSVSSIQESPNVDHLQLAHNQTDDIVSIHDGNRSINDDGYESGGDVSHTSSVVDPHRRSIFDYPEWIKLQTFPYTNKNGIEKVKFGWECMFCRKQFKDRNATKVLCHLAGIRGMHIVVCNGAIPSKHLKVIKERNKLRLQQKTLNKKVKSEIDDNVSHQQQSILSGLEAMSDASTKGMSNISTSILGINHRNVTAVRAKELDIAISDFIYSKGLPFSVSDSPQFKKLLTCARLVTSTYKVPNRNRMSTDLLDQSYRQRIASYNAQLIKDGGRFGISMYGDGATVMKMPLINIMASGIHQRSAVLDIIDTSNHLSKGGLKDARYIAGLFQPHIESLDPQHCLVDTVFFDGAANVQKAGRILEQTYPRITVLHGAEHVVSLFFADLANKNPIVSQMIMVYRKLYSIFGSGAHHSPHAIYKRYSRDHFQGKYVGLISAAETRMAGYFIAFARLLRVRNVLKSVINSSEFLNLIGNKTNRSKKLEWATSTIDSDKFWDNLYVLTQAVFPALRVLRLADRSEAGMHMLYYFTRMAKKSILSRQSSLNKITVTVPLDDDQSDESDSTSDDSIVDDISDSEARKRVVPIQSDDVSLMKLGDCIVKLWDKRRKLITTDFAVTGWLLCPIKEVHDNMSKNCKQHHIECAERVLKKLSYPATMKDIDTKVNIFHQEFRE